MALKGDGGDRSEMAVERSLRIVSAYLDMESQLFGITNTLSPYIILKTWARLFLALAYLGYCSIILSKVSQGTLRLAADGGRDWSIMSLMQLLSCCTRDAYNSGSVI